MALVNISDEGGIGWKTDKNGKRYYWDGRCKEYEKTVTTTYGTIPQSQIGSIHERMEKSLKNEREYEEKKKAQKLCPFRELRECKPECALHNENGSCNYGKNVGKIGKFCPFSGQNCDERCQLHAEYGCKI